MAQVIKNRKGKEVISRDLIFDNELSAMARFIYCYMMAKPDDWDFLMQPMADELGCHVDTLRKYINELIDRGWITKGEQTKGSSNKFGAVDYIIHEERCTNFSVTEIFRDGKNHAQQNIDIYKEENNREIEPKGSLSDFSSDDEKINYSGLIDFWNNTTQGRFGKLYKIENNRRKMVVARIRQYGKRAFVDAIKMACASSYISGATWFNFDWMIKPNNFDKLISGNYNHEQQAQMQLELNNTNLGYGEAIDEKGNRFYLQGSGKHKVVVPLDAPPRQSENQYWSESQKKWYFI